MSNPPSDEPLTKVTINLFTKDLRRLQRQEGHGWSTKVRQLVRDYITAHPATFWPTIRTKSNE